MRVFLTALVIASAALPLAGQQFGAAENLGPAIPTPQFLVNRMLEAGRVKPGEMVYDLGSGDGRVVITAAQNFGARAVGVELMPDLVRKARERILSLGLADRITIVEGSALRVDFKVTGGGSTVMSEIYGKEDMISMFHLDGANRLLLTHYCAAGNQPRMQASVSSDGKTITFNFVDATNLATPDAGRMQSMVLTLIDDNHHTEDWTFVDHGKEMKESFDLRRKM